MKGNTLKIAVIGTGSIGKRHCRNIKEILKKYNGEVIACDLNKDALAIVEKEIGIRTTSDIDSALKEADGAIIAVPNHLHVPIGLKAIKSGCHTFIEKPFADSLEHTDQLLKLAHEKKLVLTCGYMMRFYEPILKVKELLEKKTIGKVYGALAQGGFYLPDWRPTQDYRKNYGARREEGGGCILDCIHEINFLKWLLGDVQRVFCMGGKLSNLEIDTEDYASMSFQLKDEIILHLHVDYLQRAYARGFKIIGEKGTILWNFTGHELRAYNAETKTWHTTSFENFDFNRTYVAEEEHFIQCVRGEEKQKISAEEAVDDVKISLAALKSLQTGECIQL